MTGETPVITIIIPMFNVEKYVGSCIASVLSQDFREYEVICVDDGSTDKTLLRAKEAAGGDPRFAFLSQENRGQSAARNHALSFARGKYILCLDSDDCYSQETLSLLVEVAERNDADDVYFSGHAFCDDSRQVVDSREGSLADRKDVEGVMPGPQLFARMVREGSFWPSSSMHLMRRDLIEENKLSYYEGIIHEDLLFTVQVITASKRAMFLNEDLYLRRLRPNSTMTSTRGIKNIEGHHRVACEMMKLVSSRSAELDQGYRAAIARWVSYCWDVCSHIVLEMRDADAKGGVISCEEKLASLVFQKSCELPQASLLRQVLEYEELLPESQKFDFRINVLERAVSLDAALEDIMGSRTYRLGNAFLGVPRRIRDAFRVTR